jgi:hypothetical protein
MSIQTVLNLAHSVKAEQEMQLPKWICAADVKKRDAANKKNYTAAQLAQGDSLKLAVESVYGRSKVYMNFRKKFIVVKVDKPHIADRLSTAAVKLDCWCETNDVVKETTAYGNYVYRMLVK